MLIAGVLTFDEQGRIIASPELAAQFNGGTPVAQDGGLAAALGVDPDAYLGGIGYVDAGNITDSDNPLVPIIGVLTNDLGQVRVSFEAPTHWYAGLPLTADGRLAISPGVVPPVDLGAFDSAFDSSFDIGSP